MFRGVSILLAFVFLQDAKSLEVVRGRVRISADENRGHLVVSVTETTESPRWVPLWWARDPSTSFFSLRMGNRILPLVVGSQFQVVVSEEANGVLLVWKGALVEVNQRLEFLTSSRSSVADGVRMTFEIKNLGEADLQIDVRFKLDTYLGEQRDHFLVNNVPQNREFRIIGRAVTSWISPRATENPNIGLLFWLGDGVSAPTRTIFANWRRLRDTQWEIAFSEGRDFNNIPYSYNDSAVAIYWEGISIPAGASKAFLMAFANITAETLQGGKIGTDSAFDDILESTVVAGRNVEDVLVLLRRDREVVNDLLRRIDQGILNLRSFTDEELETLELILQELEGRKSVFE